MDTITARLPGELADLAAAVAAGKRLDREACLRLWRTSDLTSLGVLANAARERLHGECAFFRGELRLSGASGLEEALAGVPADAPGEILLEGDDLLGAVRRARELRPSLRPRARCAAAEELPGFHDAGVRHLVGPAERGLIEAAAQRGFRVEIIWSVPNGDAVDGLLELRGLSDRWPIVDCVTPAIAPLEIGDATGYNQLRAIAVARLCLDHVAHIRGPIQVLGESVMQVAQWYGADDAGGVSLATGAQPGLERMRELLRAAGRDPVEVLIG
jgi:hypothetical protein